jgi:glycosyltransferase involved in cell wall biosynthesis
MTAPLVSILLPTFNRPQLLRMTLDSVGAQTFRDYELIIADDGSDEPMRAWLRTLTQPGLRLIELPHSGMLARVRNATLAAARGEFVAFLDSDDLWAPNKLERQIRELQSGAPGDWSYTAFTCIDADGARLPGDERRRWQAHSGNVLREAITGELSIRAPTVVARRHLVTRAGGFDEEVRTDNDLWIRMAQLSPIQVIDAPLAAIRTHSLNMSANWPVTYAERDRSLHKLQGRVDAETLRLLRHERVRNCLALAREHASHTGFKATARGWWSGARYSWNHIHWWSGGAKVMTRALLRRS